MASPCDPEGRRVVCGITDGPEQLTALAAQLVVRAVKQAVQGVQKVAVSHTTVLDDPGALIVDLTEPSAITNHLNYCDQLLMLSPKRAALITTTAQSTWERLLTWQAEQPTSPQILKLSWRRSTRGGRPWVVPQALSRQQAASMSGDWTQLAGPARCSVHLQIQGDTSTDHTETAKIVVARLTDQLQETWTVAALGAMPRPRELAPIAGADGSWDGAFLLEATDPTHVKKVAHLLHGMCFSGVAGSHRVRMSLQHDYGNHVRTTRTGNGIRKR